MPTVVNGIGTWYYGKRRIHRLKGTCGFCNRVGELASYDTTLYFVVFFVPIIPLSRKRVLEVCPYCQQHRVVALAKWEEMKAADIDRMLEKLAENPDDRDTILAALSLAVAYQDEGLFEKLAGGLAQHRLDDPGIQAQLGLGYSYFARREEAEAAYRASLAGEDNPEVRAQLALNLLKQGKPEEAEPLLQSFLDEKREDQAGLIYLLVEGYQAQGQHERALELMDRRDAAFPQFAALKDYKKQRKTSERYRSSGKPVRSANLTDSAKVGYREGGWTARIPRLIGPLVLAGLLCWYLGAALWAGRARPVYLVNGWTGPYTVAVNGRPHHLPPGAAMPARVAEGEVTVEFLDAKVPLPPVRCRVETPFFSRPFKGRTFVINPDQLAVIVHEETEYAAVARPPQVPPQYHMGQVLYSFSGVDYEFAAFPPTIKISKGGTVKKTRVGVIPNLAPETRAGLASQSLGPEQQAEYARRWLALDPDNAYFLALLVSQLPAAEALAFLEPGLSARPLRVDWHRAYQHIMDKARPAEDLRPRYRQLVADLKGDADALYLLARVEDHDRADELLRQAAGANPPSAHAVHSLGFRALAEGRFPDAVTWMEKAIKLTPHDLRAKEDFKAALLAAGRYDALLAYVSGEKQAPGGRLGGAAAEVRAYAARGDLAKARKAAEEASRLLVQAGDPTSRQLLQGVFDGMISCATNDVAGFLKVWTQSRNPASLETNLLQGKVAEAAGLVNAQTGDQVIPAHGLVYLAALKAGDARVADDQLKALLAALAKGDRYHRQLGDMLAGRRPVDAEVIRKMPIEPKEKRVLAAVAARRSPEKAKDLLLFARKLDFFRDVDSLCLHKVLN